MTLSCLFGTTSVPIGRLKLSSMRHKRTSFFSVSLRGTHIAVNLPTYRGTSL
ncbi:hypothetical protein JG688_00006190 [Phytophthora aleatoria]|uniref:Uncharacterized protein n=1 Tax=Phytophthora aleatoria TaxID=2496075 RepID=A0A8J5ILM5_9STRA|nr:hypothetical protein JG688_00006190 [Phytophthora aleatoria]